MKSVRAELQISGDSALAPGRGQALDIVVIGTGYVGLVTAACLARCGHRVTAVDIDAAKIERLSRGDIGMHEVGLPELVQAQVGASRLRFTTDCDVALKGADLIFVAVGTPARTDGSTDMRAVDDVVRCLAGVVRAPSVVVLKSTVPIGTAACVGKTLASSCGEHEQPASVLSNPEFLRQGCAVNDFMSPERVLIGDDSPDSGARDLLATAYAPMIAAGVPVLTMDTRSAELSKHAANAMLATRISFVNEIAAIASATGADIERVCEGIGSDQRIGRHFLRAGLGYGGSCFPKDVSALRETARQHKLRSDVLLATERVNSRQRCWAFDALRRDAGSYGRLRSSRVAVWGLSFKPGTDDMRSAPSVPLIERLVRAGVSVTVYDPFAMNNARRELSDQRRIVWAESAEDALHGADALMLVTEWPEFLAFDPARAAHSLRLRTVYDGRNALDAPAWAAAGVRVVQVGRPCANVPEFVKERAVQPAAGYPGDALFGAFKAAA